MIDLTSIILGFFTLLSSCGWFVNYRKYRQEVSGLKKDNRQKDMELSKMYVDEFNANIADPLRHEVRELRNEVAQLRYAIQKINDCPHSAVCPIISCLQHVSQSGVKR